MMQVYDERMAYGAFGGLVEWDSDTGMLSGDAHLIKTLLGWLDAEQPITRAQWIDAGILALRRIRF